MQTAIRIDRLAKKYSIHHAQGARYVALRDVISESVKGAAGRIGRFFKRSDVSRAAATEDFWALSDVSFEMARGDVLGLIGRNGAGKSTLLKILSRITDPTSGRVELTGRVASLLEVGTGFHPELSGRENIFLNGAILGMRAAEIRRRFDQIAAFAEVEKFLDTPVKHYSSGMYVRLAFSVAAHLEPEILLVDEVLAVGDQEFQKKCLGKMHEISEGGRTVIFVSHNMAAVQALCTRAVYLDAGKVRGIGSPGDMIREYAADARQRSEAATAQPRQVIGALRVLACRFEPNPVVSGDAVTFVVEMASSESVRVSELSLILYNEQGYRVALLDFRASGLPATLAAGRRWSVRGRVKSVPLVEGDYSVSLYVKAGDAAADVNDLGTLAVAPQPGATYVPYEAIHRGVLEPEFLVESMEFE
jgi:lipopolysaccharide transport system ATP-binding protein